MREIQQNISKKKKEVNISVHAARRVWQASLWAASWLINCILPRQLLHYQEYGDTA